MQTLNETETGALATTVITPGGQWQAVNVRELWRFRELIGFLIWRDVKVRYKQTVLGAAWAFLQPAMMMGAIMFALGRLAGVESAKDPVFVFAGMLPWTLFATGMMNCANSVVNQERLITKIYFPRLAVPLSAVGAAVVDFLIASMLLVAMMVWKGIVPGANIVMAPIICLLIAVAASGVGIGVSALTVAYRDFRHITPFMAQFWLFATPSIYANLPDDPSHSWAQWVLVVLNPMTGLIASFRASMLNGVIPWDLLGHASVVVIVVFLIACFYFRRVEDSFADIV